MTEHVPATGRNRRPTPRQLIEGTRALPTLDDRIAELVVRHHTGQFQGRPAVQRRLDSIFAENPADAHDRLLRAIDHLGVTGHDLERLADLAVQRTLRAGTDASPAHQHSGTDVP